MNCMKCGREIPLGQAFCKDCLEDMSHYPVNPTTPVQIPVQPPTATVARRHSRPKKPKKPEEQILRLRKLLRLEAIVILLLLTMLIGLGFFTYRKLFSEVDTGRPGENYLTTETYQQGNS